jgi:antitoxin (DNA-binding transcriptional repressor) of toxin-antitoxin stability system
MPVSSSSIRSYQSERNFSMATMVDIHKAKSQMSKLLSLALKGKEVIITEYNKPRAKIVPVASSAIVRTAGLHKGKITTSRNFDAPLPDDFWTGKK